jgi:hAT family C-terminal dimerisation region
MCHYMHVLITISVLDPRISYEALQEDFADDSTLLAQLESSKLNLRLHFDTNYNSPRNLSNSTCLSSTPTSSLLSVTSEPTLTASNPNSSPQKNHTARYHRKRAAVDELTEFWNMPQEDFETCNPIKWWHQRRVQFPNLYRLAHDIFSIPGICSAAIFVDAVYSLGLSVGF